MVMLVHGGNTMPHELQYGIGFTIKLEVMIAQPI